MGSVWATGFIAGTEHVTCLGATAKVGAVMPSGRYACMSVSSLRVDIFPIIAIKFGVAIARMGIALTSLNVQLLRTDLSTIIARKYALAKVLVEDLCVKTPWLKTEKQCWSYHIDVDAIFACILWGFCDKSLHL